MFQPMKIADPALSLRRAALAVLVVMGGLLVFGAWFRHLHPVFGYIEALGGAGLAGGLADWFAVTALFRQPLGLPIPHTAVLPRNQDRIATAFGAFLSSDLITAPSAEQALSSFSLSRWVCSALQRTPGEADKLRPFVAALPEVEVERALTEILTTVFASQASENPSERGLATTLGGFLPADAPRRLTDALVETLAKLLSEHRQSLRDALTDQPRSWTTKWLDKLLANRLIETLETRLTEMGDASHPGREALEAAVWDGVQEMTAGFAPGIGGRSEGETLVETILKPYFTPPADGAAPWRRAVDRALDSLVTAMADPPEWVLSLDRWARSALAQEIVASRPQLGEIAANHIRSWSSQQLVASVERQTSRDLQYIRINGALVGGLVGLILHALTSLIR